MTDLQQALQKRTNEYSAAIDRLREATESDSELYDRVSELREAVELTRCLRRLLDGRNVREIHAAFGAPGDFGYDTPIGDALARAYREPVAP